MADGWKSVRLDEIEPIPVVDGTLLWRPVRRTLDIGAFGINAYVAPKAGDDVVEEHTEESLGHEEVYVVLAGRATFTLDDETLDAPAGTVVFVRDVDVKRHARAEEPGTVRARGRRAARRGVRAVGVGGLLRGGDGTAQPATTTRISRSSEAALERRPDRPASAVQPRVRRGARRPAATTRSSTCGARSSSGPSWPSRRARTRTSSRCASDPAGRS